MRYSSVAYPSIAQIKLISVAPSFTLQSSNILRACYTPKYVSNYSLNTAEQTGSPAFHLCDFIHQTHLNNEIYGETRNGIPQIIQTSRLGL